MEKLEQYTRRPNLRIYGVPVSENEKPSDVEDRVRDILTDSGIEIENCGLDRAHRTGVKSNTRPNGDEVYTQPIIVRFSTFRDRTKVYRKRKAIKEKFNFGVSLDLTKSRYDDLKKAIDRCENVEGIQFVYTDINCNLRVFTSQGKHVKFDCLLDLENFISNLGEQS